MLLMLMLHLHYGSFLGGVVLFLFSTIYHMSFFALLAFMCDYGLVDRAIGQVVVRLTGQIFFLQEDLFRIDESQCVVFSDCRVIVPLLSPEMWCN